MRAHFIHVWRTLSDIVVLSLFYVTGFSFALLTEPWLHLTGRIGSDGISRMARSGQIGWGMFGMAIVVIALAWKPRWFGLVAVVALVSVRAYDFWNDTQHDYFFLAGQVVFFALAVRGANRRAAHYG